MATLVADISTAEPDLIFSHKFHISEASAECSACHPNAETSTMGTDDLLPKETACMECHDKKTMDCKSCHKSGDNPILMKRIAEYSPKFNHAKHIEKGYKCMDCHEGIQDKNNPGNSHLPTMTKCMTCYETPEEITGCYKCHSNEETLKPADHNELWAANHGIFSESGAVKCATCHSQSFCTECHLGENLLNTSHPPQFILTHSMSFIMKESDCIACHNSYENCIECHTKVNFVKPVDHNMDWPKNHMTEAKMKADLCVVCHTENDQTCMRCHK